MSVMSQCYAVIIDRGISAPGHGKVLFDGINAIEKRYIHQLMSNFQLPGSKTFDSQIIMLFRKIFLELIIQTDIIILSAIMHGNL